MEWAPRYTQGPNALADVYVPVRATGAGDDGGRGRGRGGLGCDDEHAQRQPGLARPVDRQRAQQHA